MNTEHKIPAPRVTYHKKAALRRPDPARIWLRASIAAAIIVGICTTIYLTNDTAGDVETATFAQAKVEKVTCAEKKVETATFTQAKFETVTRAEEKVETVTYDVPQAESEKSTSHNSHVSKPQPRERSNKQNLAKVTSGEEYSIKAEPAVELALANETATASTDIKPPQKYQASPQILIIIRPKPNEVIHKESPKQSIAKLVEGKIKDQASNIVEALKTNFERQAKIVPELWASINIPGIKNSN